MVDYVISDFRTPELAEVAAETVRDHSEVWSTISVIDADKRGLSYAEAINEGLAMLDTEPAPIVCALNADVECLDSQEPIARLFAQHPEIAVIGPRQMDQYGIVRHAGIVGTNKKPVHRFWGCELDLVAPDCSEELLDCVTVSGSVYYARRTVWDELGGFLPTPFYFEETWFSYLSRHRGHRVCYSGLSTWIHHWGSSPVGDDWKQEKFRESQAIFREACAREGIECD